MVRYDYELLASSPTGLPAEVLRPLLPERVGPARAARLGRELSSRPDRFEAVRDRGQAARRAVTAAVTAPVTAPPAAVTAADFPRGDSNGRPRMPPRLSLPSRPTEETA